MENKSVPPPGRIEKLDKDTDLYLAGFKHGKEQVINDPAAFGLTAARQDQGVVGTQVREAMNKCFGRAVDGWFAMPEAIADEIISSLNKKP